jgi:aldehyde dehydrogenase (NAD+)
LANKRYGRGHAMLHQHNTSGEIVPVSSHPSVPVTQPPGEFRLDLLARQDQFFQSGRTREIAYRLEQLQRLKAAIKEREQEIMAALYDDLRKHPTEAYMTEIGIVYAEITEVLKNLKSWARPQKIASPLGFWPAKAEILREPYGRVLIISPWNYPLQLALAPLIGAIAAGNVVVVKPSELAPATARVLYRLIGETFPPELCSVVEGGAEVSQKLLDQRWDHIFFTGSTSIGKIVAQAAARHLTPCVLELGGKSPCIITAQANLDTAARRVVFGKFLNSGQTCVAPDYILVESSIREAFISRLKSEITTLFGSSLLDNEQLPRIISARHFQRLQGLIEPQRVIFGGQSDAGRLLIAPTLMDGVDANDPVMQEEIFGPILPILTIRNIEEAKNFIAQRDRPLALYLFSDDRREQKLILEGLSFGGGCINDTLLHVGIPDLPFGGVGASGLGNYHGRYSFECFTHQKSIVRNSSRIDFAFRYQPWTQFKDKLFRLFLR